MLIAAKELVLANNRLATRQVNATMGTTHHIFLRHSAWRLILLDIAAITFKNTIDDPST